MNERQAAIYEALKELLNEGKPTPTVKELGSMFGMTQQAMSKNLKVLEQESLIRRKPGAYRNIELCDPPPRAVKLPLVGTIAAGQPLEAIEDSLHIIVPEEHLPKSGDAFALRVQGESMIEDGILDGDFVVIKKQTTAFNGQIVVAVVNEEATLKHYFHEGHRVRLEPANRQLQPIFVGPTDRFEIRGIVHALYRDYGRGPEHEAVSA